MIYVRDPNNINDKTSSMSPNFDPFRHLVFEPDY